jgi:outer membrane lipoprotein SlyB
MSRTHRSSEPTNRRPSMVLALACLASLSLVSCAPAVAPHTYTAYDAGRPMSVRYGVVDSVKAVKIQTPPTGAGAAVGSTVGAIAGAAAGSNNSCYYSGGSWWGAVAGALLGGLVGSAIEASASNKDGLELRVQMNDGETLVIVQDAQEAFKVGDFVELVTAPDGSARLQHTAH